jgi:hypothetical protein
MNYPAPDGTIIQSSSNGPVSYACAAPVSLSEGTYESFETSSKSDNSLQQIRIVRVVSAGQVQITVTERTQQEIEQYFQNIGQ